MNFKALALGAFIGFLVAVVPSCGGAAKCSATTCATGCCDSANKCVAFTGQSATSCGAAGAECKACTGAETCSEGVCKLPGSGNNDGGPGGCAANACKDSSGFCVDPSGQSATRCGSNSAACVACGPGQTCTSGACTGGTAIGAPCTDVSQCSAAITANRDCKKETRYKNLTYPGGFCTRRCTTHPDCGANARCLIGFGPFGEPDNICLPNCSDTVPCNTGYGCFNFYRDAVGNPLGNCFPLPSDGGTSIARVDGGQVMVNTGNACTVNTDCQSPIENAACIPAALPDGGPTGFPAGYCSGSCTYGDDPACGADGGGYCSYQFDPLYSQAEQRLAEVCFKRCVPDGGLGGCRTGYVCAAEVQGSPNTICVPP
jgi:hypothetical protein